MTQGIRPDRLFFPAIIVLALIMAVALSPVHAMQDATPDDATPVADVGPRFAAFPKDGVEGDFFTVEAEPGSTSELTIVFGNVGQEPLGLRTYAADVVPVTNGGFALGLRDEERTGPATWLDYADETFELAPEEGIERSFTVSIPTDAQPGEYVAGIAVETADPLEVEGTDLLNQILRKSIAVLIIVPGPENPSFTFGEPDLTFAGSVASIEVPVENSGNVMIAPEGELTLTNADGEVVLTAPVSMRTIYPGITAPLSVPVQGTLEEGDYTVSVTLSDDSGATASVESAALAVTDAAQVQSQFGIDAEVTLMPDPRDPSFADVAVTIANEGGLISNAEVVMDVMRDGELVETFALAQSLALPQGETSISERYIPPTGWETGSWSFVLRLNVVDPGSGTATNVADLDTLEPIQVGE